MPSVDGIENAKQMREELQTLEQFEGVGSYGQVAKKYLVSKTTAHAHLMHLRSLAKIEKGKGEEMKEPLNCLPTAEEIETFHTDAAPKELPKVEFCIPLGTLKYIRENAAEEVMQVEPEISASEMFRITMDETDPEVKTVTYCRECGDLIFPPGKNGLCDECHCRKHDEAEKAALGKISPETGRYICVDCGDGVVDEVGVYAQSGLCNRCNVELNEHVESLENQWKASAPPTQIRSLEGLWKSIESDITTLHKMHIEQAEKEFKDRLRGVIEAC